MFTDECYSFNWGPGLKLTSLPGAHLKQQLSVPRPGEKLAACIPPGDPGHYSEGYSRTNLMRDFCPSSRLKSLIPE